MSLFHSLQDVYIKIIHRHGYDQSVDGCEQMCLKEMLRRLAELGVREGEWRAKAGEA